MLSASPWAVAQVTSGQEIRFRDEVLEAQEMGLGAFVPLRRSTVWCKRSRKWRIKTQPLIACYVFVYMPSLVSDWHLSRLTDGCRPRLLSRPDGSPAPVAQEDVDRLRADELSGALDTDERDVSLKFFEGRVVVVRCGLMTGTSVVVARTPRRGAQKADFLVNGKKYSMPLSLFAEG